MIAGAPRRAPDDARPRGERSSRRRASARARALAALALALACRPLDEPGGGASPPPRPAPPAAQAPPSTTAAALPDFAEVAERLRPSVVSVVSTLTPPASDGAGRRVLRGIGSGILVSTSGHVLTNEHVVADAAEVDVELTNHARVRARVVARDDLLDLALLHLVDPPSGLQPVVFRERPPRPGEWVMTMGQPFGLGRSVTVGVVSALGRDHVDLGRPQGLRPDGIWSFIQTDASVNLGNSGGPLCDVAGEVLGLTTAVRADGDGIAFAIPAAMARRFLDEVWSYGRVRHTRLGIKADNVGPEVFPGRLSAVRVTAVEPSGPGDRAGLAEGDIILAVDDQAVTRVSEVAYLAQLRGVGAHLDLIVQRGAGAPRRLQLVPAEAP